MSGTSTMDAKNSDNKQRWAALDKRHERLFNASDRAPMDKQQGQQPRTEGRQLEP